MHLYINSFIDSEIEYTALDHVIHQCHNDVIKSVKLIAVSEQGMAVYSNCGYK